IKHSLDETYSSKDWANSFTTIYNSSNKQSDFDGSYINDDTTTSTISLSKKIFDGGEAFEKASIAKDNIKIQEVKLQSTHAKILLNAVQSYLNVYTNQSVVSLRKRSLERFKENVQATSLKLEAGTVTPTVLAEAQSKLAKANYELILAKGDLNNAISQFKSITKFKVIPNKLSLPVLNFKVPTTENQIVELALKNNLAIIISKFTKSLAEKNIELNKTNNRPSLKLEFLLKDNQSSLANTTSDYQSYGANITFSSPLFYNNSSKSSLKKLEKLSLAASLDLSEKYRMIELEAISSFQNYKNSVAKTLASKTEKKSSLLALNGIQKEAEFGIRTVLDELDAEVEYLNASANLIKSEAEQIYYLLTIKDVLGKLSIKDINASYNDNFILKENKMNFKILDKKMFN
ncbi:TolC family protein, partial [Alphaproteobacteria bacterium]|nr:TolC family protein [Alphaproteobacteria bacterium]